MPPVSRWGMSAFTMTSMATTLAPTGVYRTWFPAIVRLPDGRMLFKTKVFATDAGLIIYGQRELPHPVFESPMLLDKTNEPGTDYASQQRGHVIVTEAGTVTITRGGGAGCGCNREIKAWAPPWAMVEKTWGA